MKKALKFLKLIGRLYLSAAIMVGTLLTIPDVLDKVNYLLSLQTDSNTRWFLGTIPSQFLLIGIGITVWQGFHAFKEFNAK